MSDSIEQTASLYKWLFQLPTMKKLLIFSLGATLIIGITVRIIILLPLSLISNIVVGIIEGTFLLFIPAILSALVTQPLMRGDRSVWDRRRLIALSFLCVLFLGLAYVIGAILFRLTATSIMVSAAFIFGASFIFMLRLLVFNAMTEFSILRSLAAAFSQPLFSVVAFLLSEVFFPFPRIVENAIVFAITLAIFGVAALVYIWLVNQPILKSLGVKGLSFFYGFLLDWIENKSDLMEENFEKIGETTSLPVLTLLFNDSKALSSVLVVPNIHPGPFKTVGSSEMPYIISREIQKKTGAVVSVAHGPSTHGQNLVSAKEIEKVLRTVEGSLGQTNFVSEVSQFVRYEKDEAKVGCQIFGDFALLVATLAPISFDDITLDLGEQIRKAAISEGVKDAFLIDAHNCGGETMEPVSSNTEIAEKMIYAAKMAVKKAKSKMSPKFKVYAIQSPPSPSDKWEGIGPAGTTVYAVEVEGQKAAYIVIDGNNMVPGLREKILEAVKKAGVDEAEVMTSDTHIVNAVSLNPKGYNPVGQVGDHKKLINTITRMVKEALVKVQPAKVAYSIRNVEKIKIVGEKQMEILISQILKSVSTAKKSLSVLISAALLGILLQCLIFVL
jgi:putative membrane protein